MRGVVRGRCAALLRAARYEGQAGRFADAAGEHGVWRSDGFASRIGLARPREALAKASSFALRASEDTRHPWAILCNPFGVDVRRSGMAKDCAFRPSTLNTPETMREGVMGERNHGFIQHELFTDNHFPTRHDLNTLALGAASLRRSGEAERMRLAECCGLGGPRALSAGCITDEKMR